MLGSIRSLRSVNLPLERRSTTLSELPHTTDAATAIPRLVERHGDRIYALGLSLCDNPDNADDLVQETFLRALKSWDSFEGRSQASTWLYTIATRACRRMQRRRAGEPRRMEPLQRVLPSGDEGVIQLPSDDDPEADAVRAEATEAVLRAVARLPLEFRLPFVLKEMADFSVSEIADTLDVKPATVKTRLHRARLKVRQELTGSLPRRAGAPPDHTREACLALLRAKQESMDHDRDFPLDDDQLCERCRSVFETLDLGRSICRALGDATMPADVRAALDRALSAN